MVPLKDVVVGAGELALFECLVAGPPDMDVDWLSRGRLLQPALLKCKMHFDGRKCKLLLTSVHEDDSGIYTCKLSTAKGKRQSCSYPRRGGSHSGLGPRGVLGVGRSPARGFRTLVPLGCNRVLEVGDREWSLPQELGRLVCVSPHAPAP